MVHFRVIELRSTFNSYVRAFDEYCEKGFDACENVLLFAKFIWTFYLAACSIANGVMATALRRRLILQPNDLWQCFKKGNSEHRIMPFYFSHFAPFHLMMYLIGHGDPSSSQFCAANFSHLTARPVRHCAFSEAHVTPTRHWAGFDGS